MNTSEHSEDGKMREEIYALGSSVSKLEANVTNLATSVESIMGVVKDLAANQSSSQKTSWGTVTGMGALLLVIIGFVGSGYVRDMDRLEEEMHRDFASLEDNTRLEMKLRDLILLEQIQGK